MTPPIFALYFTCMFMANMALKTPYQQSLDFKSATVGKSVTFQCSCQDDAVAVMFYWYKQALGKRPRLMSTFYKHNANGTFEEEFIHPRFTLTTDNQKHLLLNIADLRISDSATYYCVKSNLYDFEFCEGTTINVKGSGLNIQTAVHQSSSEIVQPERSVTLNCTVHTGSCDGEHSVYWFKIEDGSHPGLIYTHGDRNDQCKRKNNTQAQTCVYNLPINSMDLSDDGTYYCAVASCGYILFGNGTKLEIESKVGSLNLVYILSGVLAFTTILVVSLAFALYKTCRARCNCEASTPNTALPQEGENLHYAALKDYNVNRSRRKKDNTLSECVYSGVRQ
ncbi:uncharacterized protein LOC125018612 isoform X2 [Mugil cephalus]|uniref:uncharacterized protein LOC125018612 isoform X2 n=1 Tax=Mugil cephalus TaxID=48193 RepID=UPI001FB624F0|nr:uncharacterized protein LOC125018612 isoform X2 [Mugil cephalus]